MKRLILISASFLFAAAAIAQSDALYRFDNAGSPKEVRQLGSAPEFPFLRNMKSSTQVYNAIKRHENDNTESMRRLNGLLKQVGYANGAKDLEASDISEAHLAPGTEGNMGSAGYTYGYYRLAGDPAEFRAWKIEANTNANGYGPLYLFAKCGNAFFPKGATPTACINVPVNLTGDMNEVTLNSSGAKVANKDEVFVYYSRKRGKKNQAAYNVAGINDKYPSKPVRIITNEDVNVLPETYTISASAPQRNVAACPGKTLDLTANINVEKTSSYTGNYPTSDHKTYKKLNKKEYKMVARRMRRIDRKANKIARKTGVPVNVSSNAKNV